MTVFELVSVLVSLTAGFSFLNSRFLRFPGSIGVTLIGLAVSVAVLLLATLHVSLAREAVDVLARVKFNDVLFQGLLSFLLFAGALSLDTHELLRQRWAVLTFALVSTLLSIGLVGGLVYVLLLWAGVGVAFPLALLFGAIISPTDPVAVLDLLRRAKVPAKLEALIAGESLFNDGIGVVAFAVIAAVALGTGNHTGNHALDLPGVALLFAREALGGVLFGGALGLAAFLLLRQVDDYVVEVLITLAVVTGGYALASHLHVSGPLAMVVAGLLVGRLNDHGVLSATSRPHFDSFWHLTEELLNTGLFVLIALEVIAVNFSPLTLLLGLACIPIVLLSRAISVRLPMLVLRRRYTFSPFTAQVMIWGGLRGGIAVALAFSVPPGPTQDVFLVLTYVVVVFSIVVQGLSMGRLSQRVARAAG